MAVIEVVTYGKQENVTTYTSDAVPREGEGLEVNGKWYEVREVTHTPPRSVTVFVKP